MSKNILLGGAVAAGLAVTLVGAPLLGMRWVKQAASTPQPVRPRTLPIVRASTEDGAAEDRFVGVLLPPQRAELAPRAPGQVLKVHARVGQAVGAREPLVSFDVREAEHDLAMAKAELDAARADAAAAAAELSSSRRRLRRRRTSIRIGGQAIELVSGEELAQARADVERANAELTSAQARVDAQQARVEQLSLGLEESVIRAPFAGTVSFMAAVPAMQVSAGEVLTRLIGGHGLRARLAVPETASAYLGRARVELELEDGRRLAAQVEQVSPEPEPASRAFMVEAIVDLKPLPPDSALVLAGRPVHARLLGH